MKQAISISFAAAAIFVGLLLLTGCIYIPTFNNTVRGTNASKVVGDARSDRPLRVGEATRDQIKHALGIQYWDKNDKGQYIYVWTVQNGVWIYPFCFRSMPQHGSRTIEFQFDDAGILREFHITALNDDGDYLGLSDPNAGR